MTDKVKEDFITTFGENQYNLCLCAVVDHRKDYMVGDDPRDTSYEGTWVCLILIGYECISKYKEYHGITICPLAFRVFCLEHKESFDSYPQVYDLDWISLFAGIHGEFLNPVVGDYYETQDHSKTTG